MSGEHAAFRGSVIRSYVEAFRAEGCFDAVRARVSTEVGERMDMLPTSSEWVSAHVSNGVLDAYLTLRDLAAVRALARAANRQGLVRIVEPMVRTAMRLGGGSPAAILSRLELILGRQQRGYEFRWSPVDGQRGTLVIVTQGIAETTASVASWEGGLANAFDLAGTPGTIRAESVVPQGGGSKTTFVAQW